MWGEARVRTLRSAADSAHESNDISRLFNVTPRKNCRGVPGVVYYDLPKF
jgi:hypothetical protein